MGPNFENRSLNTFFNHILLRVSAFDMIYQRKQMVIRHKSFQVEKNDSNALALIDICFDKISDFNHFHELCTGSTVRLGTSLRSLHETSQISGAGNFDELHDWLPINSQAPIQPSGKLSTGASEDTPNLKRKRTDIDSSDSSDSETYVCVSSMLPVY